MAKKVTKNRIKYGKGKYNKKPNLFSRLGNFFKNLSKEIKKVIWPDRNKLKRAASVTITIIVAVALLIFVTDTILQGVLKAAGFDKPNVAQPSTEVVSESTDETEAQANSDAGDEEDGSIAEGDESTADDIVVSETDAAATDDAE